MRRMNLPQLTSFFTFDLPINYSYLYSNFRKTHERQRYQRSSWPVAATRQKLVADYWGNALVHYLLLIILSAVVVILFSLIYGHYSRMYLLELFLVGIPTYLPMYFLIYRPTFNREFLPNLETIIAEYEGKEHTWLEKCKQDQPSNRALVLLFYVLDKTSKMDYLSASDKCADLLHRFYGVSPKGMKNELDLIFKKEKRAKLEPRHLVEVSKSFEEAYTLLEVMQFTEGIQQLKELELRFTNETRTPPK